MKSWKWQNLKELIESMTLNEKRYFSLYQKDDSNKNFMKLYEAIQEKTDEKTIKKKLAKQKINVSYEKSYLIKVILRSLRNYHETKTLSTELNQALIDIELLFERRLYIFCSQFIDYYFELSKQTESYTFLLQLIRWKRKCIIRLGNPLQLKQFIEEEFELEKDCLYKMNINAEVRYLQQQMLALINQKGNSMHHQDKEKMNNIIHHPLVQATPSNASILAKLMTYEIKIWYAYYSNDYKTAYEQALILTALVEENPFIEQYNPQLYYASMANLYFRAYKIDATESMNRALVNIESMVSAQKKNISDDLKNEAMQYVLERKLVAPANNNDFDKAIQIFYENKKTISKGKYKFKQSFYLLQYFFVSYCYFHKGDYESALKFLKRIIDNFNENIRYDYVMYARILNLLVQFELGNYLLIPHQIKSIQRSLDKNQFKLHVLDATFSLMKKLSAPQVHTRDKITHYQDYLTILNTYKSSDDEEIYVESIGLRIWAQAKLKNM